MWTCNQRLDLETLASQLIIMPKNLPDHWLALIEKRTLPYLIMSFLDVSYEEIIDMWKNSP